MRWFNDQLYLPIDPIWRPHPDCVTFAQSIRDNGGYARVIRKYNNPQLARTWMRVVEDMPDESDEISPTFPPPKQELYDWNWSTYVFSVHDAWNMIDDRYQRYQRLTMGEDVITYWYRRCLSWLDDAEDVYPSRLRDKVVIDKELLQSQVIDCNVPLLVAYFPQEGRYQPWIIDGWKRLYTAYHQKLPLSFYVLSPDDTASIVL